MIDSTPTMPIAKRSLCLGEKNGRKCRRWKNLNIDGFCEQCFSISANDNGEDYDDDELCGMCSQGGSSKETESSSDPGMQIQCDLCDDWFHASCTGSKEFTDYIGMEPPSGLGESNGSMAINLWFCSICCLKKATFLKDFKNQMKNVSNIAPVHGIPSEKVIQKEVSDSVKPPIERQHSQSMSKEPPIERHQSQSMSREWKSKLDICKYYKKGQCRHGQSGKTQWNGQTCKFYHPKKCYKFCKYGLG